MQKNNHDKKNYKCKFKTENGKSSAIAEEALDKGTTTPSTVKVKAAPLKIKKAKNTIKNLSPKKIKPSNKNKGNKKRGKVRHNKNKTSKLINITSSEKRKRITEKNYIYRFSYCWRIS